eukprot:gnl/MRDRNA2_/MRDRNA2_201671_c0_seq1.p1 gnl/MRDRNA2_/MRDRNA2_201671_c0~~gnl/MRDRNA2_/MRDRNA2_201671_c0_seq1.p1  ORF type:complete len:115 (-),score=1.23 gnl/MRDRNA2_/MRDRNA2_201671_c0_seq1:126-470(-)
MYAIRFLLIACYALRFPSCFLILFCFSYFWTVCLSCLLLGAFCFFLEYCLFHCFVLFNVCLFVFCGLSPLVRCVLSLRRVLSGLFCGCFVDVLLFALCILRGCVAGVGFLPHAC